MANQNKTGDSWIVKDGSVMTKTDPDAPDPVAVVVARYCSLELVYKPLADFAAKQLGLNVTADPDDENIGVTDKGGIRFCTLIESHQDANGSWTPVNIICRPHERPGRLRINDGIAPLSKEQAIAESKNLIAAVKTNTGRAPANW